MGLNHYKVEQRPDTCACNHKSARYSSKIAGWPKSRPNRKDRRCQQQDLNDRRQCNAEFGIREAIIVDQVQRADQPAPDNIVCSHVNNIDKLRGVVEVLSETALDTGRQYRRIDNHEYRKRGNKAEGRHEHESEHARRMFAPPGPQLRPRHVTCNRRKNQQP